MINNHGDCKSLTGVVPIPNRGLNGLYIGVTNHLLSGMILQVRRLNSIYLVQFHRDLTRQVFPPNGGDCKGNPIILGNSRLVKYYNSARYIP